MTYSLLQGNLPEEMQSRVLLPSGRGRRSAAAIAAAAAALQPCTQSSSSAPAPPPASDFYNTLASLSAMTGSSGSAAADLMRFSTMPYGLGLGSLGLTNPMYAASLASLGILPGMLSMPGFDGEAEKDANNSGSKEPERSAASDDAGVPTSSLHPSFPYLYNPLIYSQLYAQSLAAATASNFGLPEPFGSLALGLDASTDRSVTEESKSDLKVHKSRKSASATVSSSVPIKEGHRPVHAHTEPVSHITVNQLLSKSSYSLEAVAGDVPDQSEPEDLSVFSKKRRESADNISSSKTAVSDIAVLSSSHDDIEDLSRKPSVPAVILSVPESRSLVIGSSSRVSPSAEKPVTVSTSAVKDSTITAANTVKSLGSQGGRLRSRLIDSIGTKLMARKQKVKPDSAETSSSGDVKPPPAALTAQSVAEPLTMSSSAASDNPEQTDSSAIVPIVAEKSSPPASDETVNTEQAPL